MAREGSLVSDTGGQAPTVRHAPIDPVVVIQSPEGVPVSFVLATPFERALAFALDFLFSQLMTIALVLILVVTAAATLSEYVLAIALMGLFVFRYAYFLVLESRYHGATPGKRILGLRVVRRDGGPLDLEATLARTVLRELELTLPIALLSAPAQFLGRAPVWLTVLALSWLAIVLLLPVLTKERVRAGDLVAGTVVVRVPRHAMRTDAAKRAGSDRGLQFTSKHLAHYGEKELEALAELFRAHEIGRAEVSDLTRVAETICQRIGLSTRLLDDPERFLRDFYRAQRTELERRLVLGQRVADKHARSNPRS